MDTELPPRSDISAALALGVARLDAHEEAERQAEESWLRIVDGTSRSARAVPAPKPFGGRYPEMPSSETRVDLRF